MCVKPLRCSFEVIQKSKSPTTVKGCRGFAGMINFLKCFCPESPKLLIIYDLTSKCSQLIWGKE